VSDAPITLADKGRAKAALEKLEAGRSRCGATARRCTGPRPGGRLRVLELRLAASSATSAAST
jgi:hypothetical protein